MFKKNDLYIESPFLHEKFIYTNINILKSKIIIGLVHEAMWAGHIKGLENSLQHLKIILEFLELLMVLIMRL